MDFYEFGFQAWLTGFSILAILLVALWQRKRNIWYLLAFSGFWLYLLLLVNATLFPIPMGGEAVQPWQYILQQVNLIPFKYLIEFNASPGAIFSEISGNIMMTMPFGFGLNFLTHIKLRNFGWVVVLVGFSIETAQLGISLAIGRIFHTIDITDVILNSLGVLLGYACFRLFSWMYRHGLGAFINGVVQQQ